MIEERSLKTKLLNRARRLLMLSPFESAVAKAVRGHFVTDAIARMAPNHYQYPCPSPRSAVRHGLQFELDLSDLMDWHLFYDFVECSHERLFSLCRPGMTVLDVGTNIGAVLLRMADEIGPAGTAYGFEPNPSIYEKCARNISLNSKLQIHLSRSALGSQSGHAWLQTRDPRNLGKNSIRNGHVSGQEDVQIDVTTLDDFAAERNINKIDLIKIDVEGYEKHVLLGAESILSRFRPLLFIELSDSNLRRHDSSARDMIAFLESRNYRLDDAHTGDELPDDFFPDGIHMDVIATPREASL